MKRKTKLTTLEIGSISTGTLRVEDLIPALLDVLEPLRLSRDERRQVQRARTQYKYLEQDRDAELCETLTELYDIAENHCPDYCYFGSIDGDGADIGAWTSEDAITDAVHDGTMVRDDQPPHRAVALRLEDATHWLQVSDHGNATLYRRAGRRWIEVWSVV